jgi:hypothetical protein
MENLKTMSLLILLISVVSHGGLASSLNIGEIQQVDLSKYKEKWREFTVKPWISSGGELRLVTAISDKLRILTMEGALLGETNVTFCSQPVITINEKSSTATIACGEFGEEFSIVDLKTLAVKKVALPTVHTSAIGDQYNSRRYGKQIRYAFEGSNDPVLVVKSNFENINDEKDQFTQFLVFSAETGNQLSSIEIPGYIEASLDEGRAVRFFKNKNKIFMNLVSTHYRYWLPREGANMDQGKLMTTVNLTTGMPTTQMKIPTKRSDDVDSSCLDTTEPVDIDGKSYLVAKKYSAYDSCKGFLDIKWRSYSKDIFQFALVDALSFRVERVIQSRILKGWEERPFQFDPNTYLDSTTYVDGRPALRSSYANMTSSKNKALYIDLVSGDQFEGPFGSYSFALPRGEISVGYTTSSDFLFQQIQLALMDQPGLPTIQLNVPACAFGKCYSLSSEFSAFEGGYIAAAGELYFLVLREDKSKSVVSVLRLD